MADINTKFYNIFVKISGDDMEINAWELQDILNNSLKSDLRGGMFTIESCKSMVALNDDDQNGKLGFEEFKDLWWELIQWTQVFRRFDTDNSGTFSSPELRMAIGNMGHHISSRTFDAITVYYADKQGQINYDAFIGCVMKLKSMFKAFVKYREGNQAVLSLDELIRTNIYS